MKRYRLTESILRGMIKEAVKSTVLQQIRQNPLGTAELARKIWDKGGNRGFKSNYRQPDYRLLKNDLKNKNNGNFNFTDDEKQKLQQILARESRLRGMIREAVKSALTEDMSRQEIWQLVVNGHYSRIPQTSYAMSVIRGFLDDGQITSREYDRIMRSIGRGYRLGNGMDLH